ncbi:MAG: hypothetical protein M1829_004218 [Trizodia sp. TS-e1964]|nr:MAG: hypothetical protein M1829_004218 [Trizodia sp. TS-e1964]
MYDPHSPIKTPSTLQCTGDNGQWKGQQPRVVSFSYRRPECGTDNPALLWRYDTSEEEMQIPTSQIITIAPNLDNKRFCIVVSIPASSDLPSRIQSYIATGLPQEFLEDYQNGHGNSRERFPEHLSLEGSDVHIIVSRLSGTGLSIKEYESFLTEAFNILGIAFSIHHTDSTSFISTFASNALLPRAIEGRKQTVILLSGDGGISDLLNALRSAAKPTAFSHYMKPVVALLPAGTANALFHSLHPQAAHKFALRSIFTDIPQPLKYFSAAFSPGALYVTDEGRGSEPLSSSPSTPGHVFGAVVFSWGFHASLVADSDTAALRKYGKERFQRAALALLHPPDGKPPHAYRGRVSYLKNEDGPDEWVNMPEGEHAYVLVTLVSNLEESFTISPRSTPTSQNMFLLHFGPMSAAAVQDLMALAYQGGQHVYQPGVTYVPTRGVRIEFDEEVEGDEGARWRRVCVDGRIVSVPSGGWAEVRSMVGEPVVLDVLQPRE